MSITHPFAVLRQKEHRHAVVPLTRQQRAVALRLLAEEAMRYLEQDARAVSGVALQATSPTMLEVHQNRQGVVNNCMASLALYMGNCTDAAGIVIKLRPPEPLLRKSTQGLHDLSIGVLGRAHSLVHRLSNPIVSLQSKMGQQARLPSVASVVCRLAYFLTAHMHRKLSHMQKRRKATFARSK